MNFLYYFVRSSDAWTSSYHNNFFIHHDGFTLGLVGALVIGILVAAAFYFLCCNSKTTCRYATLPVWCIALALAAVVAIAYADQVVIGSGSTTDKSSLFRRYSFYQANEDYYVAQTNGAQVSTTLINDLSTAKERIKNDLNHYRDVRLSYDITTGVLAVIFFFLASVVIKRFTINGRTVPFLKP